MPAPKGHLKYKGCEKGGAFGYLGKPQDAYTEEDLHSLGKDLIDYMKEPRNIWAKGFCNRKGISVDHFKYLINTYQIFKEYHMQAKSIQEEKIINHSFWKEGDGRFGEFILTQCHDDWKKTESNTGKYTPQQVKEIAFIINESNAE